MSDLREGEPAERRRAYYATPQRHGLGHPTRAWARRHARERGEDVASPLVATHPGFSIALLVKLGRPAGADALAREPS